MARTGHPIFEVIVDKLDVVAGETIMDLGCGHGPALHALHHREPSLQLIGLDVSSEAVAAVKGTWPRVWAEVTDLNEPLPLEDDSVAGVLSHNVLECLDDPVSLMNETARVLQSGGRAVWSHTDFDGIVLSGPDRMLTRKVLHAYADHPPAWTPQADGQLGRQLVGLVRKSRLHVADIAVHLTTSTELEGDARSRVDEIAAALRSGVAGLSADEVSEWRRQVDVAQGDGEFFFCEPAFVVTTRVA
jgi:SAM-dependent methyltransferase